MISFDAEICTNFGEASSREWLETNGIGGFASGTISGANTRRYHGLLTAATNPPLGRVVLLSKFEETLVIDGKSHEFSANQFPDEIHPQGFKYLKSFRLDPFPIWTFEIEGIELEKRVFMVHTENTTVCQWKVNDTSQIADRSLKIELKPLLAFRDYHHLRRETSDFDPGFRTSGNIVSLNPNSEMPFLFFSHNAENLEKTSYWYKDFEYAIEKERGFDFRENLFQPFSLTFDLAKPATVIASLKFDEAHEAAQLEAVEVARRERLIKKASATDDFQKQLVLAADQYIVARGGGHTIIAGYPWFSDWGRDTMISLSGLTLATNRAEIAKNILLEFSNHLSMGMLPNRFPDEGEEAEYNTVDATLWYFEAIRAYVKATGNYKFVRLKLYKKLVEIIVQHLEGTRYNIHADSDGLLYAGESGTQLTWMDAKIGDYVVTPRIGKAVEIQALWYNALNIMADFAGTFGDWGDEKNYLRLAEKAKKSFNRIFWNEAEQCLFDVVSGEANDSSVRPNQIFAVSLPHSMLSIGRAQKIVQKVEKELLTPFGLRSLSPRDPRYCPTYVGSPLDRDSAYHQGTVWAWLIGAFVDAYRKVYPNGHKTEQRIDEILSGFKDHFTKGGLGQISEIFDADAPHAPRGCPAQAWSVAEILRVLR